MMPERMDNLVMGAVFGLLSALLGYFLLGLTWGWLQEESLAYFHREVFMGSPLYKDRILSLCTLCIVPAFHLAYRRRMDQFARGTMLVMIGMVIGIVYLQIGE